MSIDATQIYTFYWTDPNTALLTNHPIIHPPVIPIGYTVLMVGSAIPALFFAPTLPAEIIVVESLFQ